MDFLMDVSEILEEGYKLLKSEDNGNYTEIESYGGVNHICFDENLPYINWLLKNGYREGMDLIYADPPFFSGSNYAATIRLQTGDKIKVKAYNDRWNSSLNEYLVSQAAVLIGVRELLSDKGSIWMHLDYHVSHYVKILMDAIFGVKNFINEIIWQYKSGGSSNNHFSRKHDTIFFYAKSKNYYLKVPKEKSYNRGFKQYRFKNVKEYRDDIGWYTMVNMKDVWNIDMVGRTSAERTGYATQKPMALMERIILSASCPGDICGDFFAGSGSFMEAASKLDRKWIGCEESKIARPFLIKRLVNRNVNFSVLGREDINDEFNVDELDLSKGDRELVANLMVTDPGAFDYIESRDYSFDGDIHIDEYHWFHQEGKKFTEYTVGKPRKSGNRGKTSIVKYDVFGNRKHEVRTDDR